MEGGVRHGDTALESSFVARDLFTAATEGSQVEHAAYLNAEQDRLVERAERVFVPSKAATDLFNEGFALLRQATERRRLKQVRLGMLRTAR